MTLIVALKEKDKILLCADKKGSTDFSGGDNTRPKIFKVGDMYFGYTSSFRMGQLLEFHLSAPSFNKKEQSEEHYLIKTLIPKIRKIFTDHGYSHISNNEEIGGNFLIVLNGRIFEVQTDFSVLETVEDFNAVGSGEYHAKASLFTTKDYNIPATTRVELAMQTAAHYVNTVGSATDLIEIKLEK